MNPIYKFEITSVFGQTVDNKTVYPIYKNDLAVNWAIEQNEQYYRSALSGKLSFVGPDFDFINAKNIETEFELRVLISYDAGTSWQQYWTGRFWKTDCEFDADNKKITVTPTVYDEYNDVVAGLEKEYNLIDLAPEIEHITLDKRPMIQVYSPGGSVIACFLSGMYWEQDCTPETNETKLLQRGDRELNFALAKISRLLFVSGNTIVPDVNGLYEKTPPPYAEQGYEITKGSFKLAAYFVNGYYNYVMFRNGVATWYVEGIDDEENIEFDMASVNSGTIHVKLSTKKIYARLVLDVEQIDGSNTYLLPEDDIVGDNRNYRRVIGYEVPNTIYFSGELSDSPTKYGIYQPGKYYKPPYIIGTPEMFPVARSAWDEVSIWYSFSAFDITTEQDGRKAYTLKDAYPLSSVISVLLGQIAPDVLHEATSDYSQFLYGSNPVRGAQYTLFITPKSNILAGDYDQPAQKAPATLKMITDMLRDCFRCYWFIDKAENGDLRFRIEHISWFLNGGSYSGMPVVGTDLTQMTLTRNGKKWAFATSQFAYDKPQMPERYQFGWMDDVTELFEGLPIDIQSKFVQPGNIEKINVANFTSDVDYMLLNPGACSEDGFALLGAVSVGGKYVLPYYNFELRDTAHIVQNGYMAFYFLQGYYLYDMPAERISAQNVGGTFVRGVKKQKTQQLQYPAYDDPNLYKLVKTYLGNGQIEKISINLSSRMAKTTLRYDTE